MVAWYFRLARSACKSFQFRPFPPWPLLSDTAITGTLLVCKDLDMKVKTIPLNLLETNTKVAEKIAEFVCFWHDTTAKFTF